MKINKKFRKGFTLVELVVVIAVIAILAAVSVGAYFGVTDSANSSNASVALKQVKDYWLLYSVEDYDSSKSLSETGDDFCIRYLTEYQGYTSTYVNYAIFTIDSQVSSLNDSAEKALILKIESNYPTYVIVKDNRIIEESTAAKSEEEFLNLINESSLVKEDADELEFQLSTIKYNDAEVRGHKYIALDVTVKKGSATSGTDKVYVKNNNTVLSADGSYLPSKFKTAAGTDEFMFTLKTEDGEEFEYDKSLVTESFDATAKIEDSRTNYDHIKYGYVVETNNILKVYSTTIPSIDEYPIIVYDASSSYYSFYNNFDELNLVENTTGKQNTIFLGTVTLDKPFVIPSGYNVIVDYKNTEDEMEQIIGTEGYFSATTMTGGLRKENKRFSDNDSKSHASLNSDQYKVNMETWKVTYEEMDSKFIKKVFTIGTGGKLTISDGSLLAVEAQVDCANGGNGAGIHNHSRIVNNGVIELKSNSTLKAVGKIVGTGSIDVNNNATIYDIFKITSFAGGTALLKNLGLLTTGNPVFPIIEYIFDNIQCRIDFRWGSNYKFLTPLTSDGKYFFTQIDLLGQSNSFLNYTSGSTEEIVVTKETKNDSTDLIHLNSFTAKNSVALTFGSIRLNVGLGEDDNSMTTLNSKDFNFPLSHIELIVDSTASLTLGKAENKSLKIEIMPTSRVINNGTLNIIDGAQLAVCSFTADEYNVIFNGKGTGWSKENYPVQDDTSFKGVFLSYQKNSFSTRTSTNLFINNGSSKNISSKAYDYKYYSKYEILGYVNSKNSVKVDVVK